MIANTPRHWYRRACQRLPQRPAHERRALLVLAWTLATALTLQLVWSMESSRRKLRQQLPTFAAQAAQMKAMHKAWQTLASDHAPTRTHAEARTVIGRRLDELGKGIRGQWQSGDELSVKGQTGLAAWVKWTAAMQQEYGFTLVRCHIEHHPIGITVDAAYSRGQ